MCRKTHTFGNDIDPMPDRTLIEWSNVRLTLNKNEIARIALRNFSKFFSRRQEVFLLPESYLIALLPDSFGDSF